MSPQILPGAGRVITGTFRHTAGNVLDLRIEGPEESIGTTANHPFWSEDRRTFVPAGELLAGELLRAADDSLLRVASIHHRMRSAPVYNLEVDAEHVYYVSKQGVLVHNSYAGGWGNIGSHGPVPTDTVLDAAQRWLRPGHREIAPGVFRSSDNLRQFRMTDRDLLPTHGTIGPHVHFEIPNPSGGPPLENLHLPITP